MLDIEVNFFTYFSKEFLIQGIVAIDSFLKHNQNASGFVVALDVETYTCLSKKYENSRVKLYELGDFPEAKSLFSSFLKNRNYLESIISLKPLLMLEFIKKISQNSVLVYFDADIYFYSSLVSLREELSKSEIILSNHLFPKSMMNSIVFGKFNAGLVIFKNTSMSVDKLMEWKSLCIAWCYLHLEDNKFADQKYLDNFSKVQGVISLKHPGFNNGTYYFKDRRKIKRDYKLGVVRIDGSELICFHFHGFRVYSQVISTGINRYGKTRKRISLFRIIYLPYLKKIRAEMKDINQPTKEFVPFSSPASILRVARLTYIPVKFIPKR
jgi:hypothetical protein